MYIIFYIYPLRLATVAYVMPYSLRYFPPDILKVIGLPTGLPASTGLPGTYGNLWAIFAGSTGRKHHVLLKQ
jgi:hypothetical protein